MIYEGVCDKLIFAIRVDDGFLLRSTMAASHIVVVSLVSQANTDSDSVRVLLKFIACCTALTSSSAFISVSLCVECKEPELEYQLSKSE